MRAGKPLNDSDKKIGVKLNTQLADHKKDGGVIACSALKRAIGTTLPPPAKKSFFYIFRRFLLI